MNPSDVPMKISTPSLNPDERDPFKKNNVFTRKVYFFQRENGTTFHTDAKDAWAILKGRKQHVGFFPERMKLIGVSDGAMFQKATEEARVIFKTQGLEAAQARIRQAEKDELEAVRGKIEMPPNPDNVDLQGNPFNLKDYIQ